MAMIQLSVIEGRSTPMLMCDVCEMQIDNPDMAMVKWARPEKYREGEVIEELIYCHKGQCDERQKVGHPLDQWMELEHFLARLLNNAGMTCEKIQRAMADTDELQHLP